MSVNEKCARAVAAILAAHAGSAAFAASPADDAAAATGGVTEVVVTAQRRSENVQDVPIAIQAFTGDTLQQLNVQNFDDFVKYLPNVSAASTGPGQSNVYMRGLSTGNQGIQSGGSINGFPNVAVYLDDQSGQLPGRNLDVYAADLERVEVLEGPQGTLFGAGAQAGVIRYITNKPKLNKTEASFTGGYGTTAGGDQNSELTAVLNVPLIADTLAVRGVIYNDQRGGYINNVPGTFTRKASDFGIHYAGYPEADCGSDGAPACQVPPSAAPINNNNIAHRAINPVTYKGVRVSGLWQVNDDWSALITQSYQDMDAQGVFYQMPKSSDGDPLPPQSVTLFNDSYTKDKFSNTAWTINGKFGPLKAVYTGAYLVRNIEAVQDYTNYARGFYADYYQCHGKEEAIGLDSTCFSPSTTWNEHEHNTHQSHEFRLSTPDDWRLRGIFGAFYEKVKIEDQLNWLYRTLPACTDAVTSGCMTQVGVAPGSTVTDPSIRNENVGFFNDVTRGYNQLAFFTSVDFDIIPKVLTVTGGTRYYKFDNFEKGSVVSSFGCYEAGPAPCITNATNIDDEHLSDTQKGFKSRANVTWHISPDMLVYYTWSQGFRPGAFNRSTGCYLPDPDQGVKRYCSPHGFTSDNLVNNELGWKTEFLDHRLQWNGAIYQENWDNVQVAFFDPGVLGNVGFGANGPNYRIRGLETSLIAALLPGLTVQGSASWNHSEQTNSPYLIANNPELLANPATAGEFGKPILDVNNPYGPIGGPSANSPPTQFNIRARYAWSVSDYNAFVQAGVTHTAHSYTQSSSNPSFADGDNVSTTLLRFENPPITQYDASAGIAKDAWSVEFYAENLTNVIKSTFTSTNQFVLAETITRPRVLGARIGYKF